MNLTIDDLHVATPEYDSVAAEYKALEPELNSPLPEQCLAAVEKWDGLRRRLETWASLVHLRFNQDTQNDEYKKAREFCDELQPRLTDLDVRVKRLLLSSPHRPQIDAKFGPQAAALWEADVLSFDPKIEQALVKENKLQAEYAELTAGAKVEFRGEKTNLSGIVKYREHPDRQTRHDAELVRWTWFDGARPELDRIFGDLVALRHEMARTLGFRDFVELGYKRMKRVDYSRADVETFRAEVRQHVVPLAKVLRERQAAELGVEKLMFWDDAIHDARGNPAPHGDHDWMMDRATEMFDAMSPALGSFFRLLRTSKLTDLKNRDGKSPGGFCTAFPTFGLPFIFANFNGSKHDVEVFTHEVGHAYQAYESRKQPLLDYLWPTYESCEIHSMGLEFLTWPHMEKFFEADAERFRRIHLIQALLFLPYGVAIDHFQHLVYERPEATPDERHGMWREMEAMYLPWRDYGDLPHVDRGGFWQFQRHIYLNPFYYIDYTLAQTCALQLWVQSQTNSAEVLRRYEKLCQRGGEAPFRELAKSAGVVSPFEAGCLKSAVDHARQALGV